MFRLRLHAVALITAGLMAPLTAGAEDLLELYGVALQQDPKYQAARANQSSVKTTEEIARSFLLPNIGVSASANQINNDVKGAGDDDFSQEDMSLNLTQPIYRRDRWLAVDQAKILSTKADVDFLAADQDLIVRLATAYFDVLSAQDTLTFVLADKKAIARQLEQAQQRFDVGLIAITSVYEAQAAYDLASANQIKAENSLDNAKEKLREIVGNRDFALNKLQADLELAKPNPDDLNAWTEQALAQNPVILGARNTTDIAQKEIEVQRSGHYPTFDLVGSYGLNRTDSSTGTDYDRSQIGVQLAVPLYAGGGVKASTRQAQFDFETAQFNLEQQQRAVTRQVRDAYRGVIASISQVKALAATQVSAKSALEATEAGFEVGTRTIVDVLNSQRNLFSAMNDYAQARYNYIVNGLLLKQAAGTLTEEDIRRVNSWLSGK
jgi:outer membrane protein